MYRKTNRVNKIVIIVKMADNLPIVSRPLNTDRTPRIHWYFELLYSGMAFFRIYFICYIYKSLTYNTVNPLYTDTRHNDKVRYNDNLNVTKPLLKRWRLMRNYAKTLHNIFKQHMFWIFVRIASEEAILTYIQNICSMRKYFVLVFTFYAFITYLYSRFITEPC